MNEVPINITGTVVSEPVLRRTKSGDAFLSFRFAVNPKKRLADGSWVDGESLYFGVTAFRALAINAAASLEKGQRVMVAGRLRISQWEAQDGLRTSVEIDAHDLGPSVKFGHTSFTRRPHPQLPSEDRLADENVSAAIRELENADELPNDGETKDGGEMQNQREVAGDRELVTA